ncbi:LAFE_0D10396g1_1 [Lachancea fermentati]|uniref:LAFE_0D10396g1_1 n=1 Tax=Lachancea fermentati TaxID=4955 RepID=A0A1G4MC40_LACFM|nr:LAFE_0D10396g1_1 [Lachancea fermentati]
MIRSFGAQPIFINQLKRLTLNPIKLSRNRLFSSGQVPRIRKLPIFSPKMAGYATATSIALILPTINTGNIIRNDTILDVKQRNSLPEEIGLPTQRRSRLNGKLDYRQLCLGSLLGVFVGIVVGKISSFLVFVTACGLLSLQWMQNRGLVSKNATVGLSKYVISTGKETVDLNTLVWEKPSFKISFLLTFVLAAINI